MTKKLTYRTIPGLPAPIRKETGAEGILRRLNTYAADRAYINKHLKPGKPKFVQQVTNQPR